LIQVENSFSGLLPGKERVLGDVPLQVYSPEIAPGVGPGLEVKSSSTFSSISRKM